MHKSISNTQNRQKPFFYIK